MAKFRREKEGEDGWSQWIPPVMENYKMACCDCGLVHNLQFQVVRVVKVNPDGSWQLEELEDPEAFQVLFRAQRNNRSTGAVRRHRRGKESTP